MHNMFNGHLQDTDTFKLTIVTLQIVYVCTLYTVFIACGILISMSESTAIQSLGLIIVLLMGISAGRSARRMWDVIVLDSRDAADLDELMYFRKRPAAPSSPCRTDVSKASRAWITIVTTAKKEMASSFTTNGAIGITLLVYTVHRYTGGQGTSETVDAAYYVVVAVFLLELVRYFVAKSIVFVQQYVDTVVDECRVNFCRDVLFIDATASS